MNFKKYQKEYDKLINNIEHFRDDEKGEYSWDGIVGESESDFSEWVNAPAKVAFLMKEAYGEYHARIPSEIKNNIGFKIARWKYLIWEYYKTNKLPDYPENDILKEKYKNKNLGIALIEVKKYDENKTVSSSAEILEYARKDRKLLKDQISLINPEIIICCGTYEAYENGIYQDDKRNINHLKYIDLQDKYTNVHGSIYTHNNRIIINFLHPSARVDSKGTFELLGKLIKTIKK